MKYDFCDECMWSEGQIDVCSHCDEGDQFEEACMKEPESMDGDYPVFYIKEAA